MCLAWNNLKLLLTEIPSQVIEDIKIDDKLYSIPHTGCLNLLFYRKNDQELQQAETLTEVQHIIGQCPYSAEVSPPENEGLLINFSDPTMTACLYLEAVQDIEGQYTATPTLPTPEQLNAKAITHLQQLLSMSYKPHALKESAQRAQWFAQGLGRAFWGFSESILAMKQNRENIAFKLLPLSAQKTDIPLLYVEMIGINPSVTQRGLRAQALKAANLIAAHEVLLNSLEANEQHPDPQYLLPMHQQTLNALKSNYPVYQQFYQLMQENKLRVFRLGTQSRAWFNTETQKVIQETVLKKSCPAEVAK